MQEEKGLYWTRGFFRLWLVLSLMWIGAIIAVERPDRLYRSLMVDRERAQEVAAIVAQESFEAFAGHSGQTEDSEMTVQNENLETMSHEELAKLAKQRRAALASAQLAALQDRVALKRVELQAWASLAFFPPSILFMLGFSLLWAIRGFGRER